MADLRGGVGGNGRSTSSGEPAQVYDLSDLSDLDGSRPDAWRSVVEVLDPGRPADTSGYG